jgi:hypothetical protein
VLPFGRLWYDGPNAISNAVGYATHRRRSHDAVIRVYDDAGNVIETHEHKGQFKEVSLSSLPIAFSNLSPVSLLTGTIPGPQRARAHH